MTTAQQTSRLDPTAFATTLEFFTSLDLVTEAEVSEVLAMFAPDFPYAQAIALADSVHAHVKVPDVDALPHDRIRACGVTATSETDGYIKYRFPGGINMIFSPIPISEDDMLPGVSTPR